MKRKRSGGSIAAVFILSSRQPLWGRLPGKGVSKIQNPSPKIQEAPPSIFWNAPLRDPSGYAEEARAFLFALEQQGRAPSARAIQWSNRVAHLPMEQERMLRQILARPIPEDCLHVCHILGSHFKRNPCARVCIGRTMFETDRLPDVWVERCMQMDLIWVPTEFNVQTFSASGVPREKLRVLPSPLAIERYDPNCEAIVVDGARGFNFLSVFDWTLRKGWDLLLCAFVSEFRYDEDVALVLKVHSSRDPSGSQIVEDVTSFLTRDLGCDINRIPDIVIHDVTLPDDRMQHLYRACDCYVMPTRGEGWGRPFMEAMAMELPVIGPGWGGQSAFMTAENSLLLDFTLVDVPPAAYAETPFYEGHRWAEPSLPHLRRRLRQAFEDRACGRELGRRARADVEARFSIRPVTEVLLQELDYAAELA